MLSLLNSSRIKTFYSSSTHYIVVQCVLMHYLVQSWSCGARCNIYPKAFRLNSQLLNSRIPYRQVRQKFFDDTNNNNKVTRFSKLDLADKFDSSKQHEARSNISSCLLSKDDEQKRNNSSSMLLYQDFFSIPELLALYHKRLKNHATNTNMWPTLVETTLSQLQCINVPVSSFVAPLKTVGITYLFWPASSNNNNNKNINVSLEGTTAAVQNKQNNDKPVIILLHGFDCSCFEFRDLGPMLSMAGYDVYAPDILGWGFTQLQQVSNFSADAKTEALESFIRTVVLMTNTSSSSAATILSDEEQEPLVLPQKKICIVGASLGAALAVELCSRLCGHETSASTKSASTLSSSIQIHSIVWISAQVFLDGHILRCIPFWWAKPLIKLLRMKELREIVDRASVYNTSDYFNNREGALASIVWSMHTSRDGWEEAMLSFQTTGGFNPSTKISNCCRSMTSLILSGCNDGILGETFAKKLHSILTSKKIIWIDQCGHFPHLERPKETATAIIDFLNMTQ